MEELWWLLIAVCLLASYVGLVFPIVPSVLVLWIAFLIHLFGLGGGLSVWFWGAIIVLTVFLLVVDLIANVLFVKRTGGSKWGERAALIGVLVGSFVWPPFGIIIVPFVLVLVVEYGIHRDLQVALRVGFASFVAFISGTFAKGVVQTVMVVWFLLEAL
ncbi:DUF456 domain-containing protein [Shouchella shacheensis]|uniref:DUF456 domain-containing protein n=1 Tax=Shouchella shacheensis TaxID=1649580 RepID=UPI000740272B|nr:DUF456 domain-containing protein [Shouchella shacheensis]